MKKMMTRFLLATVLTFAFSELTLAEEIATPKPPELLHSIEVIVFKYNQLEDVKSEFWTPAIYRSFNNATEVNSLASLFTLNREKTKLANNDQYTVLLHMAWKQKLSATERPVHIQGGKTYDYQGKELSEIDGTISVSKSKFVKITTNLFLTEPVNGLVSFPLQNTRNTKEKELNYFDNPAFGVLIKVGPPA